MESCCLKAGVSTSITYSPVINVLWTHTWSGQSETNRIYNDKNEFIGIYLKPGIRYMHPVSQNLFISIEANGLYGNSLGTPTYIKLVNGQSREQQIGTTKVNIISIGAGISYKLWSKAD